MNKDMTIPSWFQWVTSMAITLITVGGVPWASWVTFTLIVIQQRTERVEEHHERLASIERMVESHNSQFQIISATRFTADQGRSLESKMDKLDMQLEALTRSAIEIHARPSPKQENRNPPMGQQE